MFFAKVFFALFLACIVAPGPVRAADAPITFFVAVDGNDRNPGTAEAPVATVNRAVRLADGQPAPAEVVIRGGTYFLERTIWVPRSDKECRLVIRAAEGEEVILDGSIPLGDAQPLEGYPGVYAVSGDFGEGDREPPPVWDASGRHFSKQADLETVRETDYSSALLDSRTMVLRWRDGLSPAEGGLQMSRENILGGLRILRDRVTVRGIEFRNFISQRGDGAVIIGGTGMVTGGRRGREREGTFTAGVVIDSCRTWNCYTGYRVWINGLDATITHSRAHNSSAAVWVSGINTTIEHCELVNDPDWHSEKLTWDREFDRRGISFYGGPEDAVVRHNLIANFRTGIFSKGSPGRYIVENNTVLNGENALSPDRGFEVRRNIFVGFDRAFRSDLRGEREAPIEHNLYWGERNLASAIVNEELGGHPSNIFADPLFAGPGRGDYRLLPGSPALGLGGVGQAGAFPAVPADYRGAPDLSTRAIRRRGRALEVTLAANGVAPIVATSVSIDGSPALEREFNARERVELPDDSGAFRVVLRVRDADGRWSDEAVLEVPQVARPGRLVGEARVLANPHGALFYFEADGEASGRVEYLSGGEWVEAGECSFSGGRARPVLVTGLEPGIEYRYRVTVGERVSEGVFSLSGRPRVLYVSTSGEDVEAAGTRGRPFRTIQYALDRVLPGDRVRVMPGVYFGSHEMRHGGIEGHPIVIEGLYPNTVTLDGRRETGVLMRLSGAPHVTLRNLNFRWYADSALNIRDSEGARVTRCRFRNHYWRGASGVVCRTLNISESPGFVIEESIFTRTRYGISIGGGSPGGRIVRNTFTANAVTHVLWRGGPEDDLTIMYNSLNWNGNQMLNIGVSRESLRANARIDWNNYGTTFARAEGTETARGVVGASLERPFPYLPTNREFMSGTRTFVNLPDWREYSGQDRNSIFADPMWVDPEAGRFDVAADSPNLLPDGRVIGALGHLGEEPNLAPEVVLVSPWNSRETTGALDFEAHASDHDGRVERVLFRAGERVLGEFAEAPFILRGVTLPPGRHEVTAVAVDDRGAETVSDPAAVTVVE